LRAVARAEALKSGPVLAQPKPMSGKFSFRLQRAEPRRDFPSKLILGQHDSETTTHVLLKALGFLLFFRERLQVDVELHNDSIPFRPNLVQLDYEMRPRLWIECGDCTVTKLDKLAVKVPEAEIWIMKASLESVDELARAMAKAGLRRNRYQLIGFESGFVDELGSLMRGRNDVYWVGGSVDPPGLQMDFNGLWFDATFSVTRF
jgi:hypothetical protein